MQDHLSKLNSKKIVVPESVRTVTDDLKIMGERQWETFIHDRLVLSKVPVLQKITLNKIEIWNHTDAGQLNAKFNFLHPNLDWRKWIQLVKTKKLWLNNCLNMKLTISLKACAKMVKMASNYIMAQKLKLVKGLIRQLLWCYHMTKKVNLPS